MLVCGRTEKSREKSRSKFGLRKKFECHYCHKFGHYKKDYFKLKEKKEDVRRKAQDEKSLVVSVAEEASTSHQVFLVTVFDARSRDEWFLI